MAGNVAILGILTLAFSLGMKFLPAFEGVPIEEPLPEYEAKVQPIRQAVGTD